ncbi:MAG: hypothetical protein WCK34_13010 [Bacteroidota bacterium]|jgi:hypothetical protein
MELKDASQIFETLKGSKHIELFNTLMERAVIYSRIRVDWYYAVLDEQLELDYDRTIAHDEFILSCAALHQKMREAGEDTKWRVAIGSDRKSIGDFACLLHAIIGINAR